VRYPLLTSVLRNEENLPLVKYIGTVHSQRHCVPLPFSTH
jgi:hypothetical protein